MHVTGSFKLAIASGPFISGSRLAIDAAGISGPLALALVGPGAIDGSQLILPTVDRAADVTLVAAARGATAYSTVRVVPPPAPGAPLLAVATYDDGIALHDPKTFALLGYAAIGGPVGDVAFSRSGELLAPDTDGDTLARIVRAPWKTTSVPGVALGNEVAVDPVTSDTFVTDRAVGNTGALTRIAPDGRVTRAITGDTSEGLAIDAARSTVYVGNVNDATVTQVDSRSMAVVRRIRSVERTFGIALDPKRRRLYVVSNLSPTMRASGGYAAAIDLARRGAPIVARSGSMEFPLGAALDTARNRLFVTDEGADRVYVLDAATLRVRRAPLRTCRTPWRPRVAKDRLYVPCARSNAVDVFDLRTLHRVAHAPFATGGFPLSVALWP